MEAACSSETLVSAELRSHDNGQVEGRLYGHNNRWVEGRLQYVVIMTVRAKEIRLESREQSKQVFDVYLIPPLSEIRSTIRPINFWQVGNNITGFVVVYIKWMFT
jgi:hypothetical protein